MNVISVCLWHRFNNKLLRNKLTARHYRLNHFSGSGVNRISAEFNSYCDVRIGDVSTKPVKIGRSARIGRITCPAHATSQSASHAVSRRVTCVTRRPGRWRDARTAAGAVTAPFRYQYSSVSPDPAALDAPGSFGHGFVCGWVGWGSAGWDMVRQQGMVG